MPLLDIPVAGGDSARSAQGSTSRDASGLVPRSNAASQLGDALGALALQTKQSEARNAEHADLLAATRASAEYEAAAKLGVDALNPLAPDYEDQLNTVLTEARESAIANSGVSNTKRRERLAMQFEAAGIGLAAQATLNRREVLAKEGSRVFTQLADATMAKIQADPDAAGVYMAELMAQGEGALATVNPEALPAIMAAVEQAAVDARVRGYAAAGQFELARTLADAEKEKLGANGHRSIKTAITSEEQRQKNERLIETQERVADIELRISRATNSMELDEAQLALDAAIAEGLFEGRPGQRISQQQVIDARRRAQSAKEEKALEDAFQLGERERIAELQLTISRSSDPAEIAAAQAELDKATRIGTFADRPEARVQLQQAIDSRRGQIIEAQTKVDDIVGRFTAGIGLNTEKEADTAWAWYVEAHVPEADRGDPNKLGMHLANFTASAGVMPSAVKDFITRAGRQTDPVLLGNAALLHGQVTGENPMADTGANDNVTAALAFIVHGGQSPERAGELALELNKSPELKRRRKEELDDPKTGLVTGPLARDAIFSSISDAIDEGGFFSFFSSPDVEGMLRDPATAPAAAEMAGVYEGAFRQMYLVTGDAEVASKHAAQMVSGTFGQSAFISQNFTGEGDAERRTGIMRFAPEMVLSMQTARPGDHLALSGDQSREVLTARFNRSLAARYPDVDPRFVSLQPTPQTEFQLARGEQPTYAVYVADQNIPGLTRPLVENGQPVLFRMPTLEELKADPTYIAIAARGEADFARRRERQRAFENLGSAGRTNRPVWAPSTPESRARGREAATGRELGE
jgi:hypothetical protein